MKYKIILIIISFCIGGVSGYFISKVLNREKEFNNVSDNQHTQTYSDSYRKEISQEDEIEDTQRRENDSISRIDYPLIDIYFEREKAYKIIITQWEDGTIYKKYEDKGVFFQSNKEFFSIDTFPSGRGSTPVYLLDIYESDKCIKHIECSGIRPGILDDKW